MVSGLKVWYDADGQLLAEVQLNNKNWKVSHNANLQRDRCDA